MCSGKTHNLINLTAIVCVTTVLVFYAMWESKLIAIASASAVFATIFLSPDLDLKHSRSAKAWGWFHWLWYAYHRCFAHRKFSHVAIVGTMSRLLYLSVVILGFVSIYYVVIFSLDGMNMRSWLRAQTEVGRRIREFTYSIEENSKEWAAFVGGVIFSDCLHLIADFISSFHKRLARVFKWGTDIAKR